MKGETVILIRRIQDGLDEGNNPIYKNVTEEVSNVLVGPPNGENSNDSNRPDGVTVDATLYFPRSFQGGSVRGAKVRIRDDPAAFKVVGNPFPVDGGMTPTDWNMAVEVTRSQG